MKILFSPIGTNDPVSNFRDGSMLHICRTYKPDKVVLYLSKEMLDLHKSDNRYMYCLEALGELLNHQFDFEIIEKPELVEVQLYDVFYKEFNDCLKDIHDRYPEAEVLLNISSGTPAMKNALNLLSILSDFKLKAIQVSTPQKSFNPHSEDKMNYDYLSYWELNEDNNDYVNRCAEVQSPNQKAEFSKHIIINHILAYDYVAALSVAETIENFLEPHVMQMLRASCFRASLDYSKASKTIKDIERLEIPVKPGDGGAIVEYLLSLSLKLKRQEYADFLRGFTPVFNELLIIALKYKCQIKIEELTYKVKEGSLKWSDSLEKKNPEIYKIFVDWYGNSFKGGWVYSDHMLALITKICPDKQFNSLCDTLRTVEEKVRNEAAHNLVSVSDDYIRNKCGKSPNEIMKLLQRLTVECGIKVRQEDWKSYDKMNENIISKIQLY